MSVPQPAVLSRRRLAIGAAWSVPTILVATAAPALAASGEGGTLADWLVAYGGAGAQHLDVSNISSLVWEPGQTFTWTVQNTSANELTFALKSGFGLDRPVVEIGGNSTTIRWLSDFILAPGEIATITFTLIDVVPPGGTIQILFQARGTDPSFASSVLVPDPELGPLTDCVSWSGATGVYAADCPI